MRAKFILVLMLSMVPIGYSMAEFVEKRSKKGPSISALKQSCCEELGDFLQSVGPCLVTVGELQKRAVTSIQGYWQGDKNSFCERVSRQQLAACKEHLCSLKEKIECVVHECQSCIHALDEGKAMVPPVKEPVG